MLPEPDIVEEVQQALDGIDQNGVNQNTQTDIRDIITTFTTGSSSDSVSDEQQEEQSRCRGIDDFGKGWRFHYTMYILNKCSLY